MCDPTYCEMDVWAKLIADFKAASPGMVTVLGSVDATITAAARVERYGCRAIESFESFESQQKLCKISLKF